MPHVLYEEVLEVDERVVLHRGEPGAGSPVKGPSGHGERDIGAVDDGQCAALTPLPALSWQAALGTCWRCRSLWT